MVDILTVEEIAEKAEEKEGTANIGAINEMFRKQDESHLWPIRGKFNVTERAIRKARLVAQSNGPVLGLEYAYLLDTIISEIVNNEENW